MKVVFCSFATIISSRDGLTLFGPARHQLISPGQNVRHFTDNIFKCIFLNGMICILIWISLQFVPTGPIDNKWTLVQVMAWRRTGDKPIPELMLTQFANAYMLHQEEMS